MTIHLTEKDRGQVIKTQFNVENAGHVFKAKIAKCSFTEIEDISESHNRLKRKKKKTSIHIHNRDKTSGMHNVR